MYIIHTNDLKDIGLRGNIFMYADDIAIIYSQNNSEQLQKDITEDMDRLEGWRRENLLTINKQKTHYIVFSLKTKTSSVTIKINNTEIKEVNSIKYLGLTLQSNLKWNEHFEQRNSSTMPYLFQP